MSGPLAGEVVSLGRQAVIGQGTEVSVSLRDAAVAPEHAQVFQNPQGYRLVDLDGPGGTFVDGERVSPGKGVSLTSGDLVQFGEGGPLAVFAPAAELRHAADRHDELLLVREDAPGGPWSISGPTVLGRSDGCDIRLDPHRDSLASSRHLHLLPAFGHLVVTDLGSANGTYRGGLRLVQGTLAPGGSLALGGPEGPRFRVEASPTADLDLPPAPETLWLEVSAAGEVARVQLALKTEVLFGAYAGLNDWETACFPRDLESEEDARERSEAIGPQHGTISLTEDGVEVRDGGAAPTKLDGRVLPSGGTSPLGESFQLDLGGDTLGLRGRVIRHPRLPAAPPQIGAEGHHPGECLVMERMGDGPDSRLFVLLVRQATLGSSDEAAIRIPAAGVAPLHALLYVKQGALWITRLGEGPVAVSGMVLEPGTTLPLALGCELFVGAARLRLLES